MFEGLKDMGKLMKQAKEMKSKMKTIQEQLKKTVVTGTSKDGSIIVSLTGELECVGVEIKAEGMDNKTLEASMKHAFNDAAKKSKDLAASQLSAVSGDLQLPNF